MNALQQTHCTPKENTDAVLKQDLITLLLQFGQADAVYCLGTTYNTRSSSGIFQTAQPTSPQVVEMVLLILLPEQNSRELQQWQDRIEQQLQKLLAVTALVFSASSFSSWLNNGHPFAQRVYRSATLIYGQPSMLPDEPPKTTSPENEHNALQTSGLILAKEFLAGTELYLLRRQYNLAAFLLHQSVEQLLSTTLLLGTGYYCQIHNLGRLLRLCSLVSPHLHNIFPQHTEIEKKRFQLLQKAYICSRYNPNFTISTKDFEILRYQTISLLNWFTDYFQIKI